MWSKSHGAACRFALAIVFSLAACGPGGGSNGPGGEGLVITPDRLTLIVGGQGRLAAEVRDASGTIGAANDVVWSAQNAQVASVGPDGSVRGLSLGTTTVTATSGALSDTADVDVVDQQATSTTSVGGQASPPATLNVGSTATRCDGIEFVPSWDVAFTYTYAAAVTNGDNDQIEVSHSGDLTATLTPVGAPLSTWGVLPASSWEGDLGGHLTMADSDTDPDSAPPGYKTVSGDGPVVEGLGRSIFHLTVDANSCTYDFSVTPFIHATLFDKFASPTTEEGDVSQGVVLGGDELGAWRDLGLAEFEASYDAHSTIALGLGQLTGTNFYFPGGLGVELWVGAADLSAPEGAATVSYTILCDVPVPDLPRCPRAK